MKSVRSRSINNSSINELSTDISLCDSPSSLDFISYFGDSTIQCFDSGSNHIVFKRLLVTPSTQTYCKQYLYSGNEVLIAIAEKQTAAYGATGSWIQDGGDFACSWSFKLSEQNEYLTGEILMRSVVALFLSIAELFERYLSYLSPKKQRKRRSKFDLVIKYPNDIMVKMVEFNENNEKVVSWKKVAGIICEECSVQLKNQNLDAGLECVTGMDYMTPLNCIAAKYSIFNRSSEGKEANDNSKKDADSNNSNNNSTNINTNNADNTSCIEDVNKGCSNVEDNKAGGQQEANRDSNNRKNSTNEGDSNRITKKKALHDADIVDSIVADKNDDKNELQEFCDSKATSESNIACNNLYVGNENIEQHMGDDNAQLISDTEEGVQLQPQYEKRIIIGVGINLVQLMNDKSFSWFYEDEDDSPEEGKNSENPDEESDKQPVERKKQMKEKEKKNEEKKGDFSSDNFYDEDTQAIPDYIRKERGFLTFYEDLQRFEDTNNVIIAARITQNFIRVMDSDIDTVIETYNRNWRQRGLIIKRNKDAEKLINAKDPKLSPYTMLSESYSPCIGSPSKVEEYVIKSITKNNTLLVKNFRTKKVEEWCDVQVIRQTLKDQRDNQMYDDMLEVPRRRFE